MHPQTLHAQATLIIPPILIALAHYFQAGTECIRLCFAFERMC